MERKKCVDFTVKGPVPLSLEEDRPDQRSGCSIIDISFPEPLAIGELVFRNYYTACISIFCKKVPVDKDVKSCTSSQCATIFCRCYFRVIRAGLNFYRDVLPWQASIKRLRLMADPHCEQGSHDKVCISSKQSMVPWTGVVGLRIILKQPSSLWRKFGIEDLAIYKEVLLEMKQTTGFSRPSISEKSDTKTLKLENAGSKETLVSDSSLSIQSLKKIIDLMKANQTGVSVGRFEVDGSYDISHLT